MELTHQRDEEHQNHEFWVTEIIYDNPVEVTTWAYCNTCDVTFILSGTTIEFGEDS